MEEGYKTCPHCGEPIRETARVCRYCKRSLTRLAPPRGRPTWFVIIGGVLLVVGEATGAIYLLSRRPATSPAPAFSSLPPASTHREQPTAGQTGSSVSPPPSAPTSAPAPSNPPPASAPREQPTSAEVGSGVPEPRSMPTPQSTPLPVPPLKFSPIVTGNVVVQASSIQPFSFVVPKVAQDAKVRGTFRTLGGAGNEIEVAIMTTSEFENWSYGHQAQVYYQSGRVTNGEIKLDGIPWGSYVLAFSNKSSGATRQQVTAKVDLTYTVLVHQ